MTRRSRPIAALFGLASLALVLTACTPGAPAATPPSTTARPTSSAEASPTPAPVAAPAEVVIGPETVEVVDEAGAVLLTARYDEPLDAVLGSFEAVFGEAPVVGRDEGHIERLPYDTYTWGGLRLGAAGEVSRLTFDVSATGPAAGGIPVRTAEDVAIGDPRDEMATTYASTFESYDEFDIARGPAVVVDESQSPARTLSVAVYVDAPATAVTRIYAPVDSWGP